MGSPNHVSVTVPSLPGTASGLVTDVWHAVDGVRVQVEFPGADAPLLPVGRAGELAFFRADTGERVTALGKVAFRGDQDEQRVFHFLFGERTRQSLASLLEPRRAFRVHPDPDEPVAVSLSSPGSPGAIIGAARDVSKSGLGIDIPWEHEAALSRLDLLDVSVRLPGQGDELVFKGRVRNRSLGNGAIIYGLEFIDDDIAADDPRMFAIGEYVAMRSEILQRSAAQGRKSA